MGNLRRFKKELAANNIETKKLIDDGKITLGQLSIKTVVTFKKKKKR